MSPKGFGWAVVGVLILATAFAVRLLATNHAHGQRPPHVGERADAIMQRLGPPDFDSRQSGDGDDEYRLGYTLGLGTRHHLRVKHGEVAEITYSSR